VLVVIPVFNHGATLAEVVRRALTVHPDVLVVDDGSTDGGAQQLAGLPVEIARHPTNLGKGTAILTAARRAAALGMTHILTLDADGQHNPEDIAHFLPAIAENPLAIVVGKRRFEGSGVPASSRFGRAFSNFWLRVQTGRTVGDTQSGFRAYPVAVLGQLPLREKRFSFEVEVLVKAAWAGIELKDIEVGVNYPPAEERISHFHPLFDNLRLALLNTRLTMRSLIPWPHREFGVRRGGEVSLLHPHRSIRTLLQENATPGRLAMAGAAGVFLGALPLIGCHTLAILVVAGYFRLSRVAALATSQLCIPPIVPGICVEAGYFLRHGKFLTEASIDTLGYQAAERVYEWLLGSLIVGPLLAAAVGGIICALALLIREKDLAAV